MSYDVDLVDDTGTPVTVALHSEGGTYVLGGVTSASLNITYNYSVFYTSVFGEHGLRWLNEKRAEDAIPLLESGVRELGVKCDPNYWKATAGNAGYALSILLGWARRHPGATFEVR